MPERADAHIHLFENGFRGSFTGRPGVQIDELLLYGSLAGDHQVKRALVVCYEGDSWADGNNDYVATLLEGSPWIRPAAYVHLDAPPDPERLERWHHQGFVGISLYIYGADKAALLERFPDEAWSWLTRHRWIVSLNSRGRELLTWEPVLDRHPELRLVVSHLGLPKRAGNPPSRKDAHVAMGEVAELARFPGVHVKLSGFCSITEPAYGYPHQAAWPYVEVLAESFGTKRMVWGSDFTPSLGWLSFPQTFGLFAEMPFLTPADREQIEGANLLAVLEQVQTGRRPASAPAEQ